MWNVILNVGPPLEHSVERGTALNFSVLRSLQHVFVASGEQCIVRNDVWHVHLSL
jgi:hypothetical protein